MSHEPIRFDACGWFFCALLPLGFAYVSSALCHRATPFGVWHDWLAVTLSGPALYLFAAQYVLVPFNDLRRALFRNGLLYVVPFFAALHWEWIGKLTGAHFSLTAHSVRHLSRSDAIMLGIGITVFVSVGVLCFREAKRAGILGRYLTAFVALIAFLVACSLLLGADYRVHIHHYFMALCLVPFLRFKHPVCMVAQAFLVGVYVEGASRWGMGAIWESASNLQ